MDEKEKIRIAKQIAGTGKYKETDEVIRMGKEGIAREKMLQDEKKFKKDLEKVEEADKDGVVWSYQDEEYVHTPVKGTVPFTGILLTANIIGARPKASKVQATKGNLHDEQYVVKKGPNCADWFNEGDLVLINAQQYANRNIGIPNVIREVNGENREFLIMSERDILYVL